MATTHNQQKRSPYDPKRKEEMPLWRKHGPLLAAALLCWLVIGCVSSSAAPASRTPPQELFDCINDGQPEQQLTTYRDFAFQKPAR